MERVQWVDGLRGIAAFLVAFNHYFNGEIKTPYRSFWAQPEEENRSLIQLPPVRLLWAVYAMVPLHMVLSGYSISLSLLSLRDYGSPDRFISRLRSAVCRRPFRLFLPMLGLAAVSQILFFFNLYPSWFTGDRLATIERTSPSHHVHYICEYMVDNLNILNFQYNPGLNPQFWMMPHELRGSLIIYFTIFVQSTWRPNTRLWSLVLAYLYLLWFGYWDVCSFVSGLFIAEIHTSSLKASNKDCKSHTSLQKYCYAISFVAGIYLLCIPDGHEIPPDYEFLRWFQPYHWTKNNEWTDLKFPWYSLGAAMVVYGISSLDCLKGWLNAHPCQYLGKVSFPLYALHGLVYLMWQQPLRDYVWTSLTDEGYPGADIASHRFGALLCSFLVSGILLAPVIFLAAEMYNMVVEPRFARLTRFVDERLNSGPHVSDAVSARAIKTR